MFEGFPMFPAAVPTCQVSWIDCKGEPTPDQEPAVGLAVIVQQGERKAFPVCKAHADFIRGVRSHHSPSCKHTTHGHSLWTFEPYAG